MKKKTKIKSGPKSLIAGNDINKSKGDLTILKSSQTKVPLVFKVLGVVVLILLTLYFAPPISRNVTEWLNDYRVSFCEQKELEYGVIILPFKSYTDNTDINSKYSEAIEDQLIDLKSRYRLPLRVERFSSDNNLPNGDINKITEFANNRCAQIVIWGSYDESEMPATPEIKIVFTNPEIFKGATKRYQKNGFRPMSPIMIKDGDTFKTIDNIAFLIGAVSSFEVGNYKESNKLLDLLDLNSLGEDCSSIKNYISWNSVYWYLGKPELADSLISAALVIANNEVCESTYVAELYDQYSMIYSLYYGQQDSARYYSNKALEISNRTTGNDSLTLIYRINLADTYFQEKDFKEALKIQNKNLELLTDKGKESSYVASFVLYSLSTIMRSQEKYQEAMIFSDLAYNIQLENLVMPHEDFAKTFSNKSKIFNALGQADSAVIYQKRALEMRLNILPKNHIFLGHSYHNLATIQNLNYIDVHEALDNEKRALNVILSQSEVDSNRLSLIHKELFSIYLNLGKLLLGKLHLDKSREVLGNSRKSSNFLILNENSRYYYAQGNFSLAKKQIDTVFLMLDDMVKKGREIPNRTLSILTGNRAQISMMAGECTLGLADAIASLRLLEKSQILEPSDGHASMYSVIGNSYLCLDNEELALEYLLKSIEQYNCIEQSPKVVLRKSECYSDLSRVYADSGDMLNARKYNQIATDLVTGKYPTGHHVIKKIFDHSKYLESIKDAK